MSAAVIHIRLARVYIEKQWEISALEWKNTFGVNGPLEQHEGEQLITEFKFLSEIYILWTSDSLKMSDSEEQIVHEESDIATSLINMPSKVMVYINIFSN